MSERKPCVRCDRAIDAWSRICPFCNQDQSKPVPVQQAVPVQVAEYKPPEERSPKKMLAMAGAGVVLLVLAFLVGMIVNRDGAPKNAPEPVAEEEQAPRGAGPKRADTQLVPMNEPGGVQIETPITSAPATGPNAGTPAEWNRTDATAVSAAEYAEIAKRAKAEKRPASLVDPRSITGAAYAQGSQPSRRAPSSAGLPASRVAMTRPVPQYQPVPPLRGSGRAQLDLIIGPDGRVRNINVRRSLAGDTPALISAVQRWRFKPATVNGRPVSARYSVEISLRR